MRSKTAHSIAEINVAAGIAYQMASVPNSAGSRLIMTTGATRELHTAMTAEVSPSLRPVKREDVKTTNPYSRQASEEILSTFAASSQAVLS